jgi:hypothetical protein
MGRENPSRQWFISAVSFQQHNWVFFPWVTYVALVLPRSGFSLVGTSREDDYGGTVTVGNARHLCRAFLFRTGPPGTGEGVPGTKSLKRRCSHSGIGATFPKPLPKNAGAIGQWKPGCPLAARASSLVRCLPVSPRLQRGIEAATSWLPKLSPPHRRTRSSPQTLILAWDWVAGTEKARDDGAHGLRRHSISEVSQCSTGLSNQALPSLLKPGGGVTWMRNGTLGSSVGWGRPGGPTSQAFLMARSSRPRAFCPSWSIKTVASLSRSQVTAPLPS